ncbi:MAG: tRNA (N6-isopentenyl adenosine(37)-C2)-methylthiotransferase MiaB [Flavobacteriales bacterium]|nr:tRNA (N6-isopentenyl adenosine(37)-C2)-methylthiotransferase MiaB [Bacteroidota bacterium]MCB9240360.1 tRNA (N6-isopentenyl adenosine(37)-C2)-methylthiotransferase MiaB [Flavobacteriales bacterium]
MNMSKKNLYIESYGCAMNFSDSEVVASIMAEHGYNAITSEENADVIFINTCSIRDNAEQKIRHRLKQLRGRKERNNELVVGVLGCMAERLRDKLMEEEKLVDVVAGPDAYRDLPQLVGEVEDGNKAINVLLSLEETYAEITPTRLNSNGVTAYISIMRGCDNMCSFCVVPFTRGRERSREPETIVREARELFEAGYKEVTLLGQNVDSYLWYGGGPKKDFNKLTDEEKADSVNFSDLLRMVAAVSPSLRVRFSTSHPKDITDDVLYAMRDHTNICNYIHLPAQSGNSRILEKMNRTYDREWYMNKVKRIRKIIPNCGISCDIIAGFCTETEDEHQDTLSLMAWSEFDFSYMYYYSERPGTLAARKFADDVPLEVKKRRLTEIIDLQNEISRKKNKDREGSVVTVLVENESKRSDDDWMGKCDQHIVVIFPKEHYRRGDYVDVRIERTTTTSLIGKAIGYNEELQPKTTTESLSN